MKNNIGKEFGMLTVLEQKRENNRTYYFCRCKCGTKKWIRADTLTRGVVSCGCFNKKNNFKKAEDITNKVFGRLTALEPTNKKAPNGNVIWKCRCECGNIKEVAITELKLGRVSSCGCLKKECNIELGKIIGENNVKKNIIDKVNVPVIKRTTLLKSNTSGITGVSYDSKRNKYVAQIGFKCKNYRLGRFDTKEEAERAYKKAKEELHGKFLKEHNIK